MGVTVRSSNRIPKLKKVLAELGKTDIKVGVFGDKDAEIVTIARANEFGVTIKPTKKKWLALPTPLAKGKRPKDFNDLKFIETLPGKKAVLVKETTGRGKNKTGSQSSVYFILVKAVNIPERSFLRAGFDKNVDAVTTKIETLLNDVFRFGVNPHVFAEAIGQEFAGLIQMELRDLNSPGNAPLTVANKKSDNPLINTGRLVGAIDYKVEG